MADHDKGCMARFVNAGPRHGCLLMCTTSHGHPCFLYAACAAPSCSPACPGPCKQCNTNATPPTCVSANEGAICGTNSKCVSGTCTYFAQGETHRHAVQLLGSSRKLTAPSMQRKSKYTLLPSCCSVQPSMPTMQAVQHYRHSAYMCKRQRGRLLRHQ